MIDATPSLRAAEGVSAGKVAGYLRSAGWSDRPSRVDGFKVFSRTLPEADEPVQILLPVKSGFSDEQRRVADALRTIQVIEQLPLEEVVRRILARADTERSAPPALPDASVASITAKSNTTNLIDSDKIDGTAVYGADDRKIGNVQRVMIDKISGQVRYVVVSAGGFLGMGEDYYPMPWEKLNYDTRLGGYRLDLTEAQLKGAPKFNRNTDWDWSNQVHERIIKDYYSSIKDYYSNPV